MLESYHEEIIRKKRVSRIFWLIVFLFAGFLYFFFQGYYPVIDFRLTNIGSGDTIAEEGGVTIRSFGIVNVKVLPADSSITLNDSPYDNNSKKMTSYGDYTLVVSGEGHLPNTIHFSIDKEKPYFIDVLSIIPKPVYFFYQKKIANIARIATDAWTAQTASGMLLFEKDFSSGTLISSKNLTHIGEGRFLSGNTIVSYDLVDRAWVTEKNMAWKNLLTKCSTSTIKDDILFCPKTREGISSEGKGFSGILDIQKEYIRTLSGLIIYDGNTLGKMISFSGLSIPDGAQFASVENRWYYTQSGSLIPLIGAKRRIITPLESIRHIEWVNSTLLIFGVKGKDTFLSFFDPTDPQKIRTIPFPDIPLDEVRIWETQGNLFIKTRTALLLIYRGSDSVLWIINGDILATGDGFALYKQEGRIWEANWEETAK